MLPIKNLKSPNETRLETKTALSSKETIPLLEYQSPRIWIFQLSLFMNAFIMGQW